MFDEKLVMHRYRNGLSIQMRWAANRCSFLNTLGVRNWENNNNNNKSISLTRPTLSENNLSKPFNFQAFPLHLGPIKSSENYYLIRWKIKTFLQFKIRPWVNKGLGGCTLRGRQFDFLVGYRVRKKEMHLPRYLRRERNNGSTFSYTHHRNVHINYLMPFFQHYTMHITCM